MAQEITERYDPSKEWPLISHGLPYPEAVARHLTQTLHCKHPFLIISRSLNRDPRTVDRLQEVLSETGVQISGARPGLQPHTYYSEVLAIAKEVKEAGADAIVTVGGGSNVDGAKVISLALANDVTTNEALDQLGRKSASLLHSFLHSQAGPRDPEDDTTLHPPIIPIISVPTTLSAGEFNPSGGATNDDTKYKQSFWPGAHGRGISVIVLDPALTTSTPERVWLGTGMRAVDHCVETVCSSNPNEKGTESSLRGVKRLITGLLRVKKDAGDVQARLECQLGAGDSMRATMMHRVHVGGSHGIGHQLGPIGVPHAETTCVCLPAVQKYNAKHAVAAAPNTAIASQQTLLLDTLWAEPDIADALKRRGLVQAQADLGDVLDGVIRELGLPRTLDEYGIGRDQFDRIAAQSLKDVCCKWNAVPLVEKEQVLEILEMCLGGE